MELACLAAQPRTPASPSAGSVTGRGTVPMAATSWPQLAVVRKPVQSVPLEVKDRYVALSGVVEDKHM